LYFRGKFKELDSTQTKFNLKLIQLFLIKLNENCNFFRIFLNQDGDWKVAVIELSVWSASVQSDQKENKSEQALQIIGHVVAESYANKHSMHGRGQFVVSNAYPMNFRRWNYDCAFYYYLIMELADKINTSNILYS
jgi:hypothetical protein